MPSYKKVSIDKIILDVNNPRINPVTTEREAIVEMLKEVGSKIYELGNDIVEYGNDPTDRICCMQHKNEKGKDVFVAREGNRRILALKAIRHPSLLKGTEFQSKFKRLSDRNTRRDIFKVDICIFKETEREACDHWMELKHNPGSKGAGRVPWGTNEKRRFAARGKNRKDIYSYVKNLICINQNVSDEDKRRFEDFPITTFDRIFNTAGASDLIGIQLRDGQLEATREPRYVLEVLMKIIRDLTDPHESMLGRKKINVSDLKTKKPIMDYLNSVCSRDAEYLSTPVILLPSQHAFTTDEPSNNESEQQPGKADKLRSKSQKTAAPIDSYANLISLFYVLRPEAQKYAKVINLKKELLWILSQPNSLKNVALSFTIVFRSLIELSVRIYARHAKISHTETTTKKDKKLKNLLEEVKNHILNNESQWITQGKDINAGVALLTSDDSTFSISEMNSIVHNPNCITTEETILTYAPRIFPLLYAMNQLPPQN